MNTSIRRKMKMRREIAGSERVGATLGFEEKLWSASDRLRGHTEPAEYKHIVLGLIFIKYISDNCDKPTKSEASVGDEGYGSEFVVPPTATWSAIEDAARGGNANKGIANAIRDLEASNPSLRGLLSEKILGVDDDRLGGLIRLFGEVSLIDSGQDFIGRIYEYFLSKFASAEGRSGGEYYTPKSVVQLLVNMAQPFGGTVYDPCCGTAGMFVQSQRFIAAHGNSAGARIYGQESSPTTWRLAKMNLALRGIQANLGDRNADTFRSDLHPDLKANYILANPPFNAKDWGAERLTRDKRWGFGRPPIGNANFAWVQHIFSHLAHDGLAGFVLSNGSLSSDQAGEGELRRRMIEADVIECVVSLPGQLFYGTQIPASLWFISPNKTRRGASSLKGRILFIDARSFGHLVDRVHAELSDDDIACIADCYHSWRNNGQAFKNFPGFAASVAISEITAHNFALVPGRYVGFDPRVLPPLDRRVLAAEMEEIRLLLGEVHAASERVFSVLEPLTDG